METSQRNKAHLRTKVLAQRDNLSPALRASYDRRLLSQLQMWLTDIAASQPSRSDFTVASYVPATNEPGATLGRDFLDLLGQGLPPEINFHLLLPVCPPGPPQPLRWGYYTGTLAPGRFGLLEPVPTAEALPPEQLHHADAILLPAVAVAEASGHRLGRGAGYYDRSLGHARASAALAAVVHPEEVLPEIPHDHLDRAVDTIITAQSVSAVTKIEGTR